jgi:hypothetical protein
MGLEIIHNRAPHTHENVQFRRIAIGLKTLFEQQSWDGLLIGNPESEDFTRFRADAILLYSHGLIVLDFKDYKGDIVLPPNDNEFNTTKWYNITKENEKIEIKGGNRFINPFMQLKSYRSVMYEVVNSNPILKAIINPSRTCALNLFSGPINLNRETPRSIPYYALCDEDNFGTFLFDYSSQNSYSEEACNILKSIFPGEPFTNTIDIPTSESSRISEIELEEELEQSIDEFLKKDESGILVLQSMDMEQRDGWCKHIEDISLSYDIPQLEVWTHSSRIRGRIKNRSMIQADSLYNTIYGGDSSTDLVEEDEAANDTLQEVIPIKADAWLDENAVIILHEAHLITRSLHQSDLLRFGSGRLLEDLLSFLRLSSNKRKIICIGDPFSLSYGKESESAIAVDNLKELFNGSIVNYFKTPVAKAEAPALERFKIHLGQSITNSSFNYLQYDFDEETLLHKEREGSLSLIRDWFSSPLEQEPFKSVLAYSNRDAIKINKWIKSSCLKNGDKLAAGDLLLLNNNVNIQDPTGLGNPTKLYNGMYVRVTEKLDSISEYVPIKQSKEPIELRYTNLKVQCLSIPGNLTTEVLILDNYIENLSDLSKEEQIALRVLLQNRVAKNKKKNPFEDSGEYKKLIASEKYIQKLKEIEGLKKELESGGKVKGKLESAEVELRKLIRAAKRKYHIKVIRDVSYNDPLSNAINASYGWAITVHKAVGTEFGEICLNAFQGENKGVNNASYFRWVYTALTSGTKCHITKPQEIHPLMHCTFEDTVGETEWSEQKASGNNFTAEESKVEPEFSELIDNDIPHNAQVAISVFSRLISPEGVTLRRTEKNGDYLSKAYFDLAGDETGALTLAVNNNGKGVVTSIRTETKNNISEELIDGAIKKVFKGNSISADSEWPDDFRLPLYSEWKNKVEKFEGTLELKKSHSYHDILDLCVGERKVQFKVDYNGKGFVTKVSVIQKNDSDLGIELHNIIL